MKIIDFHTHPIMYQEQSLVMYKDAVQLDADGFQAFLRSRGIQTFCGSVLQPQHITTFDETWKVIKKCNDTAFRLQEYYQGKYIPGVLIHPQHVNDSVEEIDRAIQHGSNLIGEICWYIDGWEFGDSGLDELLCYAAEKEMVLSVHPSDDDSMNATLARHHDLCIVGAHPGEWNHFFSQLERLKRFDNYILDISAHGIERIGSLKKLVNAIGSERIVFGSDFPSCDPIAFIACVENDPYITEQDKENILYRNAERILKLDGRK
ncbi:MAG: amidohydrolase family protein [Oscillospiraceae bacterium]|jgi:predicted TIM-barrel fold metal-dependent hydrolase|nr:amidohydrolase family protein [Oscillospiraceae bacterium]